MSDSAARARQFRSALGTFATGVTVVTTRSESGEDIGLTANSFNSVSLDPPMVLWSLSKKARSFPAFSTAQYFAVHVLADHQSILATVFATQGADKFRGLPLERGSGGTPLLPECSARFQCRTAFNYDGGDHVILVGQVEEFDHFGRPALIYQGGRYVAIEPPSEGPASGAEPESSFSQDFLIYLLGRAHFQLFLELRRDLEKRGVNEDGLFVLGILGADEDRTIAELDRLLWYAGKRVTYELVAALTASGLLSLDAAYDPHARVRLTEAGKRLLIEVVAATKAAESHAERNLGYGETRILKQYLRRIIRDTEQTRGPEPDLSPGASHAD